MPMGSLLPRTAWATALGSSVLAKLSTTSHWQANLPDLPEHVHLGHHMHRKCDGHAGLARAGGFVLSRVCACGSNTAFMHVWSPKMTSAEFGKQKKWILKNSTMNLPTSNKAADEICMYQDQLRGMVENAVSAYRTQVKLSHATMTDYIGFALLSHRKLLQQCDRRQSTSTVRRPCQSCYCKVAC